MSDNIDEEFFSRDEVVQLSWFTSMEDWVMVAMDFDKNTSVMTGIMSENFAYVSTYKSNHKIIKSSILYCLPAEMFDVVEQTKSLLRKSRTPEQEEMMKERTKVLAKVNRLYIRLGVETYGQDQFASPLPGSEKKKKGVFCYFFCQHIFYLSL
jgi:hypothetical protein